MLSPLGESENAHQEEEIYVATPLNADINKSYFAENERTQFHTEINNLREEKEKLKDQNKDLTDALHCASLSFRNVENNDEKCWFYTRLCWEAFLTTFQFLSAFVKPAPKNRIVILEDQFFIPLIKLRHDMAFEMIADLKVSVATISNIFWLWISLISSKLDFLIKWPDRENIFMTLPAQFKAKFPRLTSIIDCFEIFIESPETYRHVQSAIQIIKKKHSTVKVLISCTPNGVVSFLSCAWGGRVSDVEIVRRSGFISNKYHLPNDQILADRGFTLQDDFASACSAELIIPPFTKGKKQLSAQEVETSRKISNVRIHVERVIGLIKHRFKILQGTLPITLIKSPNDVADEEELARIDKLLRSCAVLVNMGDSIVYNENY